MNKSCAINSNVMKLSQDLINHRAMKPAGQGGGGSWSYIFTNYCHHQIKLSNQFHALAALTVTNRNFAVKKLKSPVSQPCDSTNVTELSMSVRRGIRTKKNRKRRNGRYVILNSPMRKITNSQNLG